MCCCSSGFFFVIFSTLLHICMSIFFVLQQLEVGKWIYIIQIYNNIYSSKIFCIEIHETYIHIIGTFYWLDVMLLNEKLIMYKFTGS